MVCIAAFIILLLIGGIVAFVSIFKRDFGKKYLALLKKSFHCFGKRVRLQKCDTKFGDDVKATLLKKVILKHPRLVKPLSITIEIASALLIVLTVWSLVEATKAGLALWTLGTCNVSQPSNCALGAESCSLDETNLNWFSEWGEIFSNIPDRLKTWNANDYLVSTSADQPALTPAFITGLDASTGAEVAPANSLALSIMDPGCAVCLQSYQNIKRSDFLNRHTLAIVAYPMKNPDGAYRFANSELIVRYLLSAGQDNAAKIIDRIFTGYNKDGVIYQSVFNNDLSHDEAAALLDSWLAEWGMTSDELANVHTELYSETIEQQLRDNNTIITEKIKPKGIPTMIYDGKKHLGLFKL